jgi:hypothetical protein
MSPDLLLVKKERSFHFMLVRQNVNMPAVGLFPSVKIPA